MRKNITWILLVLCCGAFAVAGCAKKETVKKDETPAQSDTVATDTTTSAPATVPVGKEPVVKDETGKMGEEALQPFETIYFDFDSYVLSQDARDTLGKNAQWMMKNPAEKVRLEGNCDERGSDEYNLALGEKRAKSALSYLLTLGVPQTSLSTLSYGKEKPADPGHDEAAWSKNRRVDFVIMK